MKLNKFFIESPINFDKKCKERIAVGIIFIVVGLISLMLAYLAGDRMLVMYLEPDTHDFVPSFYTGIGCGWAAAGIVVLIKNIRYLKNEKLKKEREIYENDERNRMLGLRCWAYTGYVMLILFYIGILISGFINMTVLKTLLVVEVVYVVVLMLFRFILQKSM